MLEGGMCSWGEGVGRAPGDEKWGAGARQNLGGAPLLWLKARATAPEKHNNTDPKEDHKPIDPKEEKDPASQIGKDKRPGNKGAKIDKTGEGPEDGKGQRKRASPRQILNLPDQAEMLQ